MSPTEELFSALQTNDLEAVRQRLRKDPTLATARNDEGVSAVRFAAYHRNREALQLLLEVGPSLDLHDAAVVGDVERLRDLLSSDPDRVGELSDDGWTPLHLACFFGHSRVAQELLGAGAPPDAVSRNEMGNTPLHAAAASGQVEICQWLLARGAEVSATQHGGWTALHSAAQQGNRALVDLLLDHGAGPERANDDGETPVETARRAGHEKIARRLAASAS